MTKRRSTPTLALALLLLSATATASPQGTPNGMNAGSRNSLTTLCQSTRDSPLARCTRGEFRTKSCSVACQRDVLSKEAELKEACAGTREGVDAFVDQAMAGSLLQLVCSTTSDDDDDDDDKFTTRQPAAPTTTARESPASSSTVPIAIRPSAPSDPDTAQGGPIVGAPQPTGAGDDQSTGEDEVRPNGLGGSPFDIVVDSSARSLGAGLAQAAAAVCGVAFLLVR